MTFAAAVGRKKPLEFAVRDDEHMLTWQEADDWLRPVVNMLQAADLGPYKRVAIVAGNSAHTLLAYVACTLAGASAVAVNSHLTDSEIAFILEDSQSRMVLCDRDRAFVAAEAARASEVSTVAAWGDGRLPTGVVAISDLCTDSREPRTHLAPSRPLVYTSGTTGRPKGVELPHTSWVGGLDIDEHQKRLGEDAMISHGRHLVVGPMYHSGPLASTRFFTGGASVTILDKFDAAALLETIGRDRIKSVFMVPTHFQRLLALPEEKRRSADLSSLEFVLQVGAKCPVRVKEAMIDWLGPIVWESYGASEVGTTCMISSGEWLERPGSVGRAIEPFHAFIRGADGRHAPPGTEGPLWFRDDSGHGIRYTSGYFSGPEFTLGEIGRMDDDGYVWITDRESDMVVSGGVNIYPAEAEQVLIQHPLVSDVACVGIPDEAMGETLAALVVAENALEPPTLLDIEVFSRRLVAGYKLPKLTYLVDDLPRTPVGKLDKRAMRALAARGSAALTPVN
ncbi:AMP-binding protein [Gordonia sp. HNM0687]|uniref:AMP-binding protein n=1 Tax=Gordonia mangrovi TaxID=2665643 RepID=A0A6L7GY89_9ACTN|nr:AMP-binding protein [Gordonia mangrovi]MXP24211.1 AMP-binding protein [Gordonia mangrovi]UVF76899.1 AMP-binding protein [Gordonia mangrovi]